MPELLIALGRANDYTSISERLEVFEYFGAKESSAIRYGVLIGLSNLATSKILPIIYKMKNKERVHLLKQIINSIIPKYNDKK
jgi:hypothetical protein